MSQPVTSPESNDTAKRDSRRLERLVAAFEQAWLETDAVDMEQFLCEHVSTPSADVVRELAAIDMEFRWQATHQGRALEDGLGGRPTWNDYARQFAAISQIEKLQPALVAEEYRVRHLWGDRPGYDRFLANYPAHITQLTPWLKQIDDELSAEGSVLAKPDSRRLTLPVDPDPRAPLLWSDYILEELLGRGGFGKVYRARQKSLDRPVAVKSLHKALQHDRRAVEMFLQEARLLARLRHPGIVGVHGLGRYPGGGYFLVLELVEGGSLQERLDSGPLPIEQALAAAKAAAEAISHAHTHGVLHGDLKPGNLLLTGDGRVVVTDFGLGHLLPSQGGLADHASPLGGTPAYAAPEVLTGEPAGEAVDVFGLGAVLYALLVGSPPLGNSAQLIAKLPEALPAAVRELILASLATNPRNRPRSANEFLERLVHA